MAKRQSKQVKIEELLPKDYMTLSEEDRKVVCLATIKFMVDTISFSMGKQYTNTNIFKDMIEVTIKKYEQEELYEECLILNDIIKMVDEL